MGLAGLVGWVVAGAGVALAQAEPFEVRAATGPVVVDGRLDEAAWAEALAVPLPYEIWPGDNAPAPVATECRLTYDQRALLVGCRADDPEPGRLRARYADRDHAFDDDFLGLQLDPFDDRRRAFEFFVNPLGVQGDLFLDDLAGGGHEGQGVEDPSWDAIWDAAAQPTATGYTVEIAIPFTSLRFPKGGGVQIWGISFLRIRPREHRYQYASEPRDRDTSCNVCQVSRVRGFTGVRSGHALELDPTLTAQRTDRRAPGGGRLEAGDVEVEPGVTATWGVTPNLILNAALNPDFSQVEADALQLDVNERFALFYEEKRPFFLEGADFFKTPIAAVFTRNVADPDWGLKATGKQGPHGFGIFVAGDDRTTLLVPGAEESRTAELGAASEDAVVRYRRDVGTGSTVGALVTSRSAPGYHNRLAGLDALLRLGEADLVRVQAAGSETRYPAALAAELGQPAGELEDLALLLAYEHLSRKWRWSAAYEDFGPEFRADLGFVPQVDRRWGKALVERTWWGGAHDWWTSFKVGVDTARTERDDGSLVEQLDELWLGVEGPRELEGFVQLGDYERTFAGRSFDGTFVEGRFELRPWGDLELEVYARTGDAIDFGNVRPADELRVEPEVAWTFGRHLRAELGHALQRLEVEGGRRLFTANLTELRLVWQFDTRRFVRAILQRSLITRDPALYLEPVERESDRRFGQFLFSYRLAPQTVLYVGYSETDVAPAGAPRSTADRSLFAKLGYAWTL